MSEGVYLSDSVKILVNILRDRIDLGLQLVLNLEKIVINPVSVTLLHLGVDEEAGIAKLRYLLGKQLDTLGRVTEDNGLSNVKL